MEAVPGAETAVRFKSDRNLTKPMVGPNYALDTIRAFCDAITCPVLAVTVTDGVYHGRVFGHPEIGDLLSLRARLQLHGFLFAFRISAWLVPHPKLQQLVGDVQRGLRPSQRLGFFSGLTHVHLMRGGHHFHMTEPELVADAVKSWVAQTNG